MKARPSPAAPKIAIVHNWMWKMRGAEKTLLQFCRGFPDADLFMLFGTTEGIHKDILSHNIQFSWLNHIPGISRFYQWTYPIWPKVTEAWDFSNYDIVISSSSSTVKGVLTHLKTVHISYIYTPMRYLWDQQNLYMRKRSKILRPIISIVNHKLRIWDVNSTNRIDFLVAISTYVKQRIEKYYGREVDTVIFPPVDFDHIDKLLRDDEKIYNDYYLVVSGFEENKGASDAVEYAIRSGIKLKLIGDGVQKKSLQKLSRGYKDIEYLGWVDDATLYSNMRNAKALLFLGVEDFGIVPVESIYLGTPVVALKRGGILDTVVEGSNGILLDNTTYEEIGRGLMAVSRTDWDEVKMKESVVKYSALRFRKEIIELVSKWSQKKFRTS